MGTDLYRRGWTLLVLLLLCAQPAWAQGRRRPRQEPPPEEPAVTQDTEAADDLSRAQTSFRRGVELYEEHALEASLEAFLQAYELVPHFRVLYNIAQVQYGLNDFAAALTTLRRYLAEGRDNIDAERRAQITEEISRLEGRVGMLAIVVTDSNEEPVANAEVLVDDAVRGTTPMEPLVLNLGWREVRVRAEGYEEAAERIRVRPEETSNLVIRLRQPGAVASIIVAPPPPPDNSAEAAAIAMGITAGGLALLTAGVGIAALFSEQSLISVLEQLPLDPGAETRARDRLSALAISADVGLALSAAAAIGFTIALVIDVSSGSSAAESGEDRTETTVHIGPASMQIRHVF